MKILIVTRLIPEAIRGRGEDEMHSSMLHLSMFTEI